MQKSRPVNLNLTTIHFPLTAIVSILHRISGVVLFLFIPVLLFYFQQSLMSQNGFADLLDDFHSTFARMVLWMFLTGFGYHFVAGIRHLLMDCGVGETLKTGKWGAIIVLFITILLAIFIGIIIWR